jgi:DNA mismatch repair protein MutS2
VSEHALRVLEFERVLEGIAGRASSDAGREAIRTLRPSSDIEWIRRELTRVEDVRSLLESASPWGLPAIPSLRSTLDLLLVEGSVLLADDLYAIGVLLGSGREVRSVLVEHGSELESLHPIRERLVTEEALQRRIERSVDESGGVLDTASSDLKRIRSGLRRAQQTLVRRLEAYMKELPDRFRVDDASVTLRDGRYVIPIRREGKGEVGGIVHDESATGVTLFVEPPVALGLMNELRELERQEQREVHRVLTELTSTCRPLAPSLLGGFEALVELDSMCARARVAGEWDAASPRMLDGRKTAFRISRGRHPLLLARNDLTVIPFELLLEPDERVLVVSGPNTGGKSVLLKATGLIASLAQSGIVPPVGPGTELPVFRSFFADIGDEQSISQDLSTFSAHLANLKDILDRADDGSMVLIDEMGTGTDPSEGAALARAILERLVAVGALGIATSHLGALKRLDEPGSGVVNASLQFDSDRMEPTYHFLKGRPGRSFGLAIARREGLSPEVLAAAEGYMDSGETSVEELLERLEKKDREAASLVSSLQTERDGAARLRSELEAREAELRKFEREAERKARAEARQLLIEARSEVDEAIEEVRRAREEEIVEISRQARRRVEEAASRQRALTPERDRATTRTGPIEAGMRVRVAGGGAKGTVLEVREDKAVVDASGLRMQIPVVDLEPVEGEAPVVRERSSPDRWEPSTQGSLIEVDLRGRRVDEVEFELGPALDRAFLTDVPELRIIHGKGTGAVRSRVTELLEQDKRVAEYRLGGPGEGGAGVTVVTFR